MFYFKFHIGDYASHTKNLSLLEDLAFRRLLDECYLHEKPLSGSFSDIARSIGMHSQVDEVEFVLKRFFEETEDGWINHRVNRELNHFKDIREKASNAGKASAERRLNVRSTDVQPTINQEPLTTNQEEKEDEPKGSLSGRVPDCPHQAVIDLWHEMLPELPQVVKWTDLRAKLLKARWREIMTDEKLTTVDEGLAWFRKLFRFVKASPFLMGKTASRDGRPFECELEWVLRPNNFVKIIEGKYHAQKN